ncbi:hypothetical protein T484DRAFT_1780074, partial [Baffinella frigidus]
MVNILEVLGVVAVPVGQTVATALVGAALAHPRIGAVTIEGKATLCKVYAFVCFPSFLFSMLCKGLSADRFLEWWPLLFSFGVNCFLGLVFGALVARMLERGGCLKKEDRGVFIASCFA